MKLFVITSARIPGEKAESIAILKNCEALKEQDCNIELLAPKRKDKTKNNKMEDYGILTKFSIHWLFTISLLNLSKNMLFQKFAFVLMVTFFAIFSIIQIKKDKDAEKFVLIREPFLAKIFVVFKKLLNCHLIYELHQLPRTNESKTFFEKFDAIIIISDYLRMSVESLGIDSEKIFYVHTGYDKKLFLDLDEQNISVIRNKLKIKNEILITYTGSLAEWKSTNFILEASKFFRKDVKFVIVGGSIEEINKFRKKYDDKKISFHGRVPHKMIPYYLHASDILVMYTPPIDKIKGLSSFAPLKLLEYMAAGKPILAPELPWIKDVIKNMKNGILFDPNSPKDLAEKIDFIIDNTDIMKKISKDAKKDAENYTLEKRVNLIIKIISNIKK